MRRLKFTCTLFYKSVHPLALTVSPRDEHGDLFLSQEEKEVFSDVDDRSLVCRICVELVDFY